MGATALGEIFAVLSGKGGTGKTTVCAGLATALAEAKETVLCVDCDVGLRNLDISLGLTDSPGLSFLEVCRGDYTLAQALRHPLYPTLAFLTAPMTCAPSDLPEDEFRAMLAQAREEFDYIFLDAPAGVGGVFPMVASAADRCLLVTGPGPAAVRDAARVAELLELMGKTDVRLVVNRVDRDMLSIVRLTVDDIMDTTGTPLAGVVLEDPHVTLAAAFGQPLLRYSRRCAASVSLRKIARRLQGYREPITLR